MPVAIREIPTRQDCHAEPSDLTQPEAAAAAAERATRPAWLRNSRVLTVITTVVAILLMAIGVVMNRSAHHAKIQAYVPLPMQHLDDGIPQAAPSGVVAPTVLSGTRSSIGKSAEATLSGGPMIARSVSLTILVRDFQTSRTALETILTQHHGYSAQLNASTPENASRSLQASLRIPAQDLAATVNDLRALGRVENESQSGEEVSQQHADLVARLKNSRESEERLRAILQQRTGKIEDVLQVEEAIARVRGEIEGMEAEQRALEHRVDFASIELQMNEQYTAQLNPQTDSILTRIHNAFVTGYENASGLLLGVVLFFAEYGPTLLILIAILGIPAYFLRKRYRRRLAGA